MPCADLILARLYGSIFAAVTYRSPPIGVPHLMRNACTATLTRDIANGSGNGSRLRCAEVR
jgi:hypothetical protein